MDNTEQSLLINPFYFQFVIQKCRDFFITRGFIESHPQNRLSILAACEDPSTISMFQINHQFYPLPQSGQMWLEHDLLNFPDISGIFCVTTSYRNEPHPIPGRHKIIFPMFEFELKGDVNALEDLEKALLVHLGYKTFSAGDYLPIAKKYDVTDIDHLIEQQLYRDKGPVFFLKNFPEYTHPFWNIRRNSENHTAHKIDVILSGIETIGSAERSIDKDEMMYHFNHIVDGEYAKNLYNMFGKTRVDKELSQFLKHKFFTRSGGGIGITRLIDSMLKEHLIPRDLNG